MCNDMYVSIFKGGASTAKLPTQKEYKYMPNSPFSVSSSINTIFSLTYRQLNTTFSLQTIPKLNNQYLSNYPKCNSLRFPYLSALLACSSQLQLSPNQHPTPYRLSKGTSYHTRSSGTEKENMLWIVPREGSGIASATAKEPSPVMMVSTRMGYLVRTMDAGNHSQDSKLRAIILSTVG